MNKWISPVSFSILIYLYDRDKAKIMDIQKNVGSSYTTISRAIDLLLNENLISEKREPNIDESGRIVVGETRWIWLTPKGRKVAKKLLEIKEIMEERK